MNETNWRFTHRKSKDRSYEEFCGIGFRNGVCEVVTPRYFETRAEAVAKAKERARELFANDAIR